MRLKYTQYIDNDHVYCWDCREIINEADANFIPEEDFFLCDDCKEIYDVEIKLESIT